MNEAVEPKTGGPAELPEAGENKARAERQARRRQFLLGGATTAGVMLTLSNRPALAQGGTKLCSLSVVNSLAANPNTSIATTLACGDPPSCWSGRDANCWSDGAQFAGFNVKYTHSTSICINSLFPVLNYKPFVNGGSSYNTLMNLISGNGNISVKCKNGDYLKLWTPSQQSNIVAAILNDYFYGDRYYPGSILTLISTCLNNVISYASHNNTNSIASSCSTLDGLLSSYNNRGDTCAL